MTITDLSLLDYEIMEVVSKHLDELELLHQDFTLIWVTKLSSKLVAPYNSITKINSTSTGVSCSTQKF
jgi:hypothetical protein